MDMNFAINYVDKRFAESSFAWKKTKDKQTNQVELFHLWDATEQRCRISRDECVLRIAN